VVSSAEWRYLESHQTGRWNLHFLASIAPWHPINRLPDGTKLADAASGEWDFFLYWRCAEPGRDITAILGQCVTGLTGYGA